ncbi:MAG TPA: nitroreductase/quinone reductase family protein, partial [Acidimicrobiia bacterium]|nr:nitroreductase/quinone reductase family protein [Acidimicrobiia bacterium]
RLVRNDMLLLTTRGHVSGRAHTVPLLYLRDGRALVVIASYGGRPDPPTWYRNLLADPRVGVQVRHRRREMTARTARPSERAVWWPRVVAAYENYATYQSRTDREIPVVLLEPVEDG